MSFFCSSNDVNNIRSIRDIRLRKAQLLTELTKDTNKMQNLWIDLTSKPANNVTPTRRLTAAMTNGANLVDGLILGWKLYRKFGGHASNASGKKGLFGFSRKKKK